MDISIITPSFRSSKWLKLCIASVADQGGVSYEHIIQDSCSDDGTLDWLPNEKRVKAFVEKDSGMYDAVNRGLRRASGEILAYLNSDEQYLPGALQKVVDFFEANANIDVLFGNFLVVDENGKFLCYRKVQRPLKSHVMVSHLPTFTCATFFRRKLIDQHGLFFDTNWRDLGDAEWMVRLLDRKIPMATLPSFISTFAEIGTNMSLGKNAQRERKAMFDSAPFLARKFSRVLVAHHRLRRLFGGVYLQPPFDYAIYTTHNPKERVSFHASKPTFIWKGRV